MEPMPNLHPPFFDELVKRMADHIHREKVDDRLLEIIQQAFEKTMSQNHVLLSRPVREQLFQKVTEKVLADLMAKLQRK